MRQTLLTVTAALVAHHLSAVGAEDIAWVFSTWEEKDCGGNLKSAYEFYPSNAPADCGVLPIPPAGDKDARGVGHIHKRGDVNADRACVNLNGAQSWSAAPTKGDEVSNGEKSLFTLYVNGFDGEDCDGDITSYSTKDPACVEFDDYLKSAEVFISQCGSPFGA